jgi:hypothetical protein
MRPEIKHDWTARLACSEAEVKRVFTKLTQEKKKSNKAKATVDLTENQSAPVGPVVDTDVVEVKPKGKRGRPRKAPVADDNPNANPDIFELLEDTQIPDSQLDVSM